MMQEWIDAQAKDPKLPLAEGEKTNYRLPSTIGAVGRRGFSKRNAVVEKAIKDFFPLWEEFFAQQSLLLSRSETFELALRRAFTHLRKLTLTPPFCLLLFWFPLSYSPRDWLRIDSIFTVISTPTKQAAFAKNARHSAGAIPA